MSRERKPLADVSTRIADVRPMSKAAEMAALLEKHRGEHHAIVMQDYPDPDAISSAWAHKLIAARFGIDCDIIYEGRISHQENLALVQLTEVAMLRHPSEEGELLADVLFAECSCVFSIHWVFLKITLHAKTGMPSKQQKVMFQLHIHQTCRFES